MTGGKIIIDCFSGSVRKVVSVQFPEYGGMGIGEKDPALCVLAVAQRIQPPDQQRLCAGTDGVVPMLAVTGQRPVHKSNAAKGGGSQRDKPVMHEQVFCDSVGGNKLSQGRIHDQGATGHVVLYQQLRQGDCSRIPSLMTEEAVTDRGAGFINQGTV